MNLGVVETVGKYVLAVAVVGAATFLGYNGSLDSEAVAALLGAVLTGPAAYAVGKASNGANGVR